MIVLKDFKSINPCHNYDEVWAIVRSIKNCPNYIRQVSALSPSKELFFEYRDLVRNNEWNHKTFNEIYLPQFLRDIKFGSDGAHNLLNELYIADKMGKKICLVCFCENEQMCHRSIIAGLLQGAGCNVITDTGNDYSEYYQMYKDI